MITVLCTTNSKENARQIATHVVQNKLAACVNIIPNILSVYTWKGNTVTDEEFLLIIKTKQELFENLKNTIKTIHPYEVPEIISIDIKDGNKDYLSWIEESLKN